MAKGNGGRPFNGPSTTGNPSGKGRGNNPSSSIGMGGGGGYSETSTRHVARSAKEIEADETYNKSIRTKIESIFDASRIIRAAQETLSPEAAREIEENVRSRLSSHQNRMLRMVLKLPESLLSKFIRENS